MKRILNRLLEKGDKMGETQLESEMIAAARREEQHAQAEAAQARSGAEAAWHDAEGLTAKLAAKDRELDEITQRCASLERELGALSLDDRRAEKPSAQLLHGRLIADRLSRERTVLAESLAVAQERATQLSQVAERMEVSARNAARFTRLTALREAFPAALDGVLAIVAERRLLLLDADKEAEAHGLPRLGRARLLPRGDQVRTRAVEELTAILSLHRNVLAIAPASSADALTFDPDDTTEEELLLAAQAAQQAEEATADV